MAVFYVLDQRDSSQSYAEVAAVIAFHQSLGSNECLARQLAQRIIEIAPGCEAEIDRSMLAEKLSYWTSYDVESNPAVSWSRFDEISRGGEREAQ